MELFSEPDLLNPEDLLDTLAQKNQKLDATKEEEKEAAAAGGQGPKKGGNYWSTHHSYQSP